jgi:molecular chaperone GrpE (heat shock protein)
VVEIIQPGFVDANGRILRAAQVVVATDEDGAW